MKNKLLVSVFAMAIAAFAFTSCENKSDVMGVCTDLVKETLHKSARGLQQLDDQSLTISELEFLGGVNDNRLVYRTIAFGDGVDQPKKVDTLLYEYGDWNEPKTAYSLFVTPKTGDPFTLIYEGNSLIMPDGRELGGDATANVARVEKWEKAISKFCNTDWEATFRGEFVTDTVWEDSIRSRWIPGKGIVTDTIKWWFGKMDTLSADTMCIFRINYDRDANFANTGHFYKRSIRSTYDRETKDTTIVSETTTEYDFRWIFSEVTSDAKFTLLVKNTTMPGVEAQRMVISKFTLDSLGVAASYLYDGLDYTRPVQP